METSGEVNLRVKPELNPSFPRNPSQEPIKNQESGSLTPKGLERIYDLKQAGRFLESVGSALPVERQQELDKSLSLYLEEQVGSNIGGVTSVIGQSERDRTADFLVKWDKKTPEEQQRSILTVIELSQDEKLSPEALQAKKQSFVNDIARFHEAKTRQNVKALSDKEIREWDDLRSRQTLKPGDQQRLKELEGRAIQERDKALGAIGMEKGPIPLLVNPEVRKRYEQLLKDQKATEKTKALQVRLQIGKGPEAQPQPKETSVPFTHEQLRALLLKQTENIRGALRKSGDYRLWVLPMNSLDYAEAHLMPKITADNNDLDGTLRLIQSMMDVRSQFAKWSEDIPLVGALRELAGMLPKQEATSSQGSSLSGKEFSQRKADLSKGLDDQINLFKQSGDYRLWAGPTQVCNTSKTLLGEIAIGGVNQSAPGMIEDRLNTVEPILKHYVGLYSRK